MTPEQIAELEAAEQAATKVPWMGILADEIHVGDPGGRAIFAFTAADAYFIVLARNHIAALLAERKRLRAALTQATDISDRWMSDRRDAIDENDAMSEWLHSTARAALRDEGDAP